MAEWGHVKVSRKAFAQDEWWKEKRAFSKWEAWVDCIQMAAWRPRKFAIGFEVEHLERGEFIASIRFLAKRWRWGKNVVQRWIEAAQKAGRLERLREGQGGTVYLLANYELYQGLEGVERDTDLAVDRDTSGTPPGHLRDKSEAVQAVQALTTSVATANGTHPKRAKRSRPTAVHANWVNEAREIYAKHIGLLTHGVVGGTLKPLVDRCGWDEVKLVLQCFCELAPYEHYLNRVEGNTLRPGEEKVKEFGYHTELPTFVKRYTHWHSYLQVSS